MARLITEKDFNSISAIIYNELSNHKGVIMTVNCPQCGKPKEKPKQNYCNDCKKRINAKWIRDNRQQYTARKYEYRDRLKKEAMLAYSLAGKIACFNCGNEDYLSLTLDHINDNGAKHRAELNINCRGAKATNNSGNAYEKYKKENYTEPMQILCANCNMKKEIKRKLNKRLENKHYKPTKEILEWLQK